MLICLIVAIIFLHGSSSHLDGFEKRGIKEIAEQQVPLPKNTEFISECHNKKSWQCQKECQFFQEAGTCKSPTPNEHCYGMPIRYNYTYSLNETFSYEFELLKRFPKCWALLGPLICSTIYRPCSKNFYVKSAMNDTQSSFVETWQVFSNELCHNAAHACSFVVEMNLWPKHLNCGKMVELDENNYPIGSNNEQKYFSDKCLLKDQLMTFSTEQCLWPLIKGSLDLALTEYAKPLIDSCYLPCEFPLAGFDWILKDFRLKNSLISGVAGVVFLGITIYLGCFTKIYNSALVIFCFVHAFFCIALYLVFWCFSIYYRASALCVDNNRIRRFSSLATFNFCAFEATFSTFCLISAYFWLTFLLILRIYRPTIRNNDNYLIYGSRPIDIKMWLIFISYFIFPSILILIRFLLWHELPVDPISGICHVAAGSIEHSFIRHGFLGFFCFIIIIAFISQRMKIRMKQTQTLFNPENVENAEETLIPDSIISQDINEKNNETQEYDDEDRKIYALEHGCGDGLFPDHWLFAGGAFFILSTLICAVIQYTFLMDIGQKGEEDKIMSSINCSLNAMKHKTRDEWWNHTINFDHLSSVSDPYARKNLLLDSASAPNCDVSLITENQIFYLFLSTIILPSLPFIIFAVSFFAGFYGHGIKSVSKVYWKNPFNHKSHRQHTGNEGFELELLSPQKCESATDNNNEDFETQTEITSATAPAIMQKSSITSFYPLADGEMTEASVHSEPLPFSNRRRLEPRRIGLNKRRIQHKKYIYRPAIARFAKRFNSNMHQQHSSAMTAAATHQFPVAIEQAYKLMSLLMEDLNVSPPPDPFTESSVANNLVKSSNSIVRESISNVTKGNVNRVSSSKPKRLKRKHDVRLERVVHARATANRSKKDIFAVSTVVESSSSDEAPLPLTHPAASTHWSISNPPLLIRQQRERLKSEYNENDGNPLSMTEEEMKENLLYCLVKHCEIFLPKWIYPIFLDNVIEYFNELYDEDETRSDILSSLEEYSDTEAVEAAAKPALYDFLWPLICKAIRKISDEMYININAFTSERTEWIPNADEFKKFRDEMAVNDPVISSSS